MREYILTDKERETVKALIERGLRLNGFRMLKYRALKALPQLREDLALIERFLEAADQS